MARWKGKAIGRTAPGVMNKTEAEMARQLAIDGVEYMYEAVTFRLAPGVTYTPDFMVQHASREIEFIEVKGARLDKRTMKYKPFYRNEDRVKVHQAAALFPMFRFRVMSKLPAKGGGGWLESPIPAHRGDD